MKKMILCSVALSLALLSFSQHILDDAVIDSILAINPRKVRYADFHEHATTKNYFNYIPNPAWLGTSPYDNSSIRNLNWTGNRDPFDEGFNNFKSYGQADYDLLSRSGASIICQSFTAIEKRMTAAPWALPPIPYSIRRINHKAVTKLPMKRLRVLNSKENSSFDEFMGEYNFMVAQAETNPNEPSNKQVIKPVKNKQELIQNFAQGNTSLVLSLEGGHILHGDHISRQKQYNVGIMDSGSRAEIITNINSIKNLPYRIFFVTLGHFCWNGMVGYPKSLDMDDGKRKWLRRLSASERFRIRLFKKFSSGVTGYTYNKGKRNKTDPCECTRQKRDSTTLGWDVITRLLAKDGLHQSSVYIDVKHMDIDARFQYYDYVKANPEGRIPIIASHVAVNGKDSKWANYTGLCPLFDRYEEVENMNAFINKQSTLPCTQTMLPNSARQDTMNWFYPWSINLSNEEIPLIYESDGIIGLSLEERVLGKNRPNYLDTNYQHRLINFLQSNGYFGAKADTISWMQPLLRNLFYVVQHSGRGDATAWSHVAIGSDFDGIMKPVKYCPTVEYIPNMHSLLKEAIPLFAAFTNQQVLLYNLPAGEIADRVIFKNGERFILKYF
jgi:hypothetical protein